MLAMSQNTLCSFSTANRAEHALSIQNDSGAFHICEHTETGCCRAWQRCDKGQGHYLNLRAQLHMSVTHSAVKINPIIYWKKEVTQTKDVNMSRWTHSLWSCQGCSLWVINIYVSPSSVVVCMIMWRNCVLFWYFCVCVVFCRKTPSLYLSQYRLKRWNRISQSLLDRMILINIYVYIDMIYIAQ